MTRYVLFGIDVIYSVFFLLAAWDWWYYDWLTH